MELLIVWTILAAVTGAVAKGKGRDGFGWFLLSMALSPLLGLILVLVLPDQSTQKQLRAVSVRTESAPVFLVVAFS